MATIVINVPDQDKAEKLRAELAQFDGVESIQIVESYKVMSERATDSQVINHPTTKPVRQNPFVDEITLASEASLAEAWLSPEDDHWDDFSKQLCTEKAM